MRISDWSSDVCSSDLAGLSHFRRLSMDWYTSCSYEPDRKRRFHTVARARLRRLAVELGFPPASFDLRSNQGGIAVSGEVTLHHERVYRSEEHTSELQSLMRISYAVFCLKKKKKH